MNRWLLTLTVLLAFACSAQTHFIWISQDAKGGARVVFSEDTDPDERVPISKIAQTKLYLRGQEQSPLPIKQGKGALYSPVPAGKTSTIGGICLYGVLQKGDAQPFLLAYYPKAIVGAAAGVHSQAAKAWKKLPLDIVVKSYGGGYQGRVLWHGKPAAGAEVIALSPGQKRVKTETKKNGAFSFQAPKEKGLVLIRARVIVNKEGNYQGKSYKSAKHYATLTFSATSAKTASDDRSEDASATQLLKDARLARATWSNFPGFSADLTVNHNGEIVRCPLKVSADGKIELDGFKAGELKTSVRRTLSSLVMHRMGNSAGRNTPCAFADKNAYHPLGRKISVLNDELHSSYRVRDRQIIEVNRQMKKIRFTITVMKNHETPEKKFLPASYVVNTWSGDGKLIKSSTHYNTWKRIGKFDLPETVMIVVAQGGTRAATSSDVPIRPQTLDVKTISFRNHRLLKR